MSVKLFWMDGNVTTIDSKEYKRMIELGELGECKRSFKYGNAWIHTYDRVDAHVIETQSQLSKPI